MLARGQQHHERDYYCFARHFGKKFDRHKPREAYARDSRQRQAKSYFEYADFGKTVHPREDSNQKKAWQFPEEFGNTAAKRVNTDNFREKIILHSLVQAHCDA